MVAKRKEAEDKVQAAKNKAKEEIKEQTSIVATLEFIKSAQSLVEKLGSKFGKKNYEDSIDYFVEKKVITKREPWDDKAFSPAAVRSLLIKVADIM